MSSSQPQELLKHLAHRGIILEYLREGTSDSRKIADKIDKSRSSIDRDLRLLKNEGYVREHPNGYDLTKYGKFAHTIYQISKQTGMAKQLIPHLLPDTPFSLINNGSIKEASGTLPQQPITHMRDIIKKSNEVKIVFPSVLPTINDVIQEQQQNEAVTIEILVSDEVLDELSSRYTEYVHVCLESDQVTLQKTSEKLSFGLVISDGETMCLGVYDKSLRLLGTITSTSNADIEWALGKFNEYKNNSERASCVVQSNQAKL